MEETEQDSSEADPDRDRCISPDKIETTLALQDFSFHFPTSSNDNPNYNYEYTLEQSRRSINKYITKRRDDFLPNSDSVVNDRPKFENYVSIQTSASASGVGWSCQQLNDGLNIIFAYRPMTKSEVKQNNSVISDTALVTNSYADDSPSSGIVAQNQEIGHREQTKSTSCEVNPCEPGGCRPNFFYSIDTGSIRSTSDEGLDGKLCRICYMGDKHESFIQPPACTCAGTMQYCHQSCLSNWVVQRGLKKCELCGYRFRIRTLNMLDIAHWKCIPMTTLDKLYICLFLLASSFILTTGVYVCWAMLSTSAAATIERESTAAQVLFPVYTGFDLFCLSIIMYVLKGRINQIWRKWRAHNRSILILSRPSQQQEV